MSISGEDPQAERDPLRLSEFYNNVSRHCVVSRGPLNTVEKVERAYAPPYNILPENLYNCDKNGFMMGVSSREHVVVFRRPDLDRNWKGHRNGPTVPQGAFNFLLLFVPCQRVICFQTATARWLLFWTVSV